MGRHKIQPAKERKAKSEIKVKAIIRPDVSGESSGGFASRTMFKRSRGNIIKSATSRTRLLRHVNGRSTRGSRRCGSAISISKAVGGVAVISSAEVMDFASLMVQQIDISLLLLLLSVQLCAHLVCCFAAVYWGREHLGGKRRLGCHDGASHIFLRNH